MKLEPLFTDKITEQEIQSVGFAFQLIEAIAGCFDDDDLKIVLCQHMQSLDNVHAIVNHIVHVRRSFQSLGPT